MWQAGEPAPTGEGAKPACADSYTLMMVYPKSADVKGLVRMASSTQPYIVILQPGRLLTLAEYAQLPQDTLDGYDVIPGFTLPVADLFVPLIRRT